VSKSKINISLFTNKKEPNKSWRSTVSNVPSSSVDDYRQGLVRGLPKLKFKKDHLYSACAMGKSKKKSHKPKSKDTNQEKLYLLHMDLCRPMRVKSVNGKKYILIIVDDYSRFTWVKCLRSKDEAPNFIIKFLKMIQVQLKRKWLPHVTPKLVPLYAFVTIYKRRTRRIIETIHVNFDELTTMASEQSSSGPALHEMTPATISSGLVPKPTSSKPVDPPAPEVIAPIAEVIALEPAESTGSPFSTTVDQDAQSPSKSQTTPETQPPVIPHDVEEDNHDTEVAHMGNDLFYGILVPEVASNQYLSTDSIHTIVHPDHQIS
nr:ribonuclease H-like domain-containing protein [Tanacetum cinerariifolium]